MPRKTTAESANVTSRECDNRKDEKNHPPSGGFLSNDGVLWTNTNPDVKLIEPQILVSLDFNYLAFYRKAERPAERRTISLTNHGDHPIAFQVQTSDNYNYFVDRKSGVIPPRQTIFSPAVRMASITFINVFRRPYKECEGSESNVMLKDKMFILLAPQFCQTFNPDAIFHNERCYEKLRVQLRYFGIEPNPDMLQRQKQVLLNGVPGSRTWKEGKYEKEQNAEQIAMIKQMERTMIEKASREVIIDPPKLAATHKLTLSPPARPRTLSAETKKKDGGGLMQIFRNLNPFGKDELHIPFKLPRKSSEQPKKSLENQVRRSTENPLKRSVERTQSTSVDIIRMSQESPMPTRITSTEQDKRPNGEFPSPRELKKTNPTKTSDPSSPVNQKKKSAEQTKTVSELPAIETSPKAPTPTKK
ncbi:unnamed protein product [Caenorhabditis sp. 36 PRJEB53466]|nr:unnamed protein product [Caenorhabditis sp. 36 PRJEB53466]